MTVKWLALVLVLGSACSAQAQQYGGPCEPERTINALANAVTRVPPLFMKPRSAPETVGAVPSAPQPSMTREHWKQSLIEQGLRFCERCPDDSVCGSAQR